MFGGALSRLLGRGATNVADDSVSRLMTNYGDDIASGIAGRQGVDAASSVMAGLNLPPVQSPTPQGGRGLIQSIRQGVDTPTPVNPGIAGNDAVSGATDLALPDNKSLRSRVSQAGRNIEEAGSKLRNNQIMGSVRDRKVAERAPDAIKWADKYGFNSNQYEDISKVLTGDEGIVSNFNNNALRRSQRSVVFPEEARTKALESVDKAITLEPHVKKNLKRVINDSYDVSTGNINTRLAERGEQRAAAMGETDIFDLHRTVQDIEKMAYEQSGKGADDVRRVLRNYANQLKKTIDEVSEDIYRNPDNIQELTQALQGANLSPQLNKDLIDQIRKGVKYTDVRSIQSPAVTLGRIAEAEKVAPLSGGIGAGGNNMFANPLLQVGNEVIGKPLASGVGKAMQGAGRAAQALSQGGGGQGGGDLLQAGALGLGGYGVLNTLLGGGEGEMQMPGGDQMAMADPMSMGVGGSAPQGSVMYEDGTMGPAPQPTIGGYDMSTLESAYVAAMMDGNQEAADGFIQMMGLLADRADREASAAEAAAGDGDDNAKAANAYNALGSLTGLLNQGGGPSGVSGALGSLLNKATFGSANPAQAAYEDQMQATAVAVARAYGEVGVLSNQDIENYRKMLPTFSDNPKQAQLKLDRIYTDLGSMR